MSQVNQMDQAVTCSQMKEIEREAAESGLSYYQMMENAGTAAAELIGSNYPVTGKKILLFCGKGNNGGDGFVAARKLWEKAEITIVLTDGAPRTQDAVKNKQLCEERGITILEVKNPEDAIDRKGDQEEREQEERAWDKVSLLIEEADIIVDAVYGTGFHGELSESVRKAAKLINRSKAVIFSLDIPSGINGDSGQADGDAVRAHHTVAFHRYKPAHTMEGAKQHCGTLHRVAIGIDVSD